MRVRCGSAPGLPPDSPRCSRPAWRACGCAVENGDPPMRPFPKTLLALLATTSVAYPWGANGHRMVGRIAENHLSKRAALQIKTLMGRETLAEASTWPDEVRSDPAWKQAAPWHYVSIDDSETY